MKKILLLAVAFSLHSCAQVQQTLNQLPQLSSQIPGVGGVDIASGLKEALNKGITQQVSKLTAVDGFYKNEAVKILMPAELQKVDATLRKIGLGSLADEGIKVLNRAAEDAVKEATPIFVSAVKNMSFTDAKNILLGNDTAATSYLQGSTTTALYGKFNPVIKSSFEKVGADVVWTKIINKYNTIPLVKKVNPDLTDYTTNQALAGVFKMIAVEEKEIRNNISARTTPLLKSVFAMQDNK
jgi:ribosomal protein S17E